MPLCAHVCEITHCSPGIKAGPGTTGQVLPAVVPAGADGLTLTHPHLLEKVGGVHTVVGAHSNGEAKLAYVKTVSGVEIQFLGYLAFFIKTLEVLEDFWILYVKKEF